MIRDLVLPHPGFDRLAAAARGEGYRFLDRLAVAWMDGTEQFAGPGERMIGKLDDDALIAVAGLNRDPYLAVPHLGRLRHLYVLPSRRREGHASVLVRTLLEGAAAAFDRIRLRAVEEAAAAFYERVGFERVEEPEATHAVVLTRQGQYEQY